MKATKHPFLLLVVFNLLLWALLLGCAVFLKKPPVIPPEEIHAKIDAHQTIEQLRRRTHFLADAFYATDNATTDLLEIVQYLLLLMAGSAVFNISMAYQILKLAKAKPGEPTQNT